LIQRRWGSILNAKIEFVRCALTLKLMSPTLRVHDPRGYPPEVIGKRLAARLENLDGKAIYLVDCLFDNSDLFVEQLRCWFGEHLPGTEVRVARPKESWADDPELRARIEADGDAAILGVGL
jgi:hypothetical protein